MRFLSPYRELFSLPRFGSSLFAAVAAKLRPGISSLALLLEVAHYRGFDQAAVVVSVSALAGATLPLRGRLVDRYGYPLVLAPALVAYLVTLAVLVLNESTRGPFAVTLVSAFLSGLSAPPIQIVTRLMWGTLTTGTLRTTVLSLDAMLTDVGFIVGPTIAAFLVVVVAPWAGLAASALLCACSTLLLLSRRPPKPPKRESSEKRHWLGPLGNQVLRRTMAAAVSFFLGVRAIELAFPAWAQQHHAPLMSGVLLSCMSVGSVGGGLIRGALPERWSAKATLPVTLVVLCLGTLLVAAASFSWTAVLIAAAAVMGIALGPSFVALWVMASDLSPADMSAETLSWISSCMSLGGSVGAAVGSVVAAAAGPASLLVVSAVALATASWLAHLAIAARPAADQLPGVDVHQAVKAGEP
ncbi:MFS transporter [Streptacidiphilus sp. PB12-B1b]|uniref:MFS transporter n=1 Tax=Streptacidiphilus sp. PB12-B1b TaxID=2705012 RepID=UPI0015FAF19B|nr:MFS transporter [Streptacidiphilus sp. PB12-B1b]QMU79095.1 MFS transporter [Streptacidiphilus sp. PB12-B1b]